MPTQSLLYRRSYPINSKISVMIPTIGDVIKDEDEYYGLVAALTAMPIDMMVALDDAGYDFTAINEYDLFLMLFPLLQSQNTKLILGDLNLRDFSVAVNPQNNTFILLNQKDDIVIDRVIHGKIAATLRKLHHLERNFRQPANEEAKRYMLQRARDKAKRSRNRVTESQLETLIIAMVNTEQFKYDYDSVLDLTIYQFNESVRQIVNKVDYEHRMAGVYAGTIDPKTLSQDQFNWLIHK